MLTALLSQYYPEINAGGYSRVDGTIDFYLRINALLHENMRVLDYGAGRGVQHLHSHSDFKLSLKRIQGKVRHLAGVDVDPVVLTNPALDEAKVIEPGGQLPFENEHFDLIFSDWVLEHVANPGRFAEEVARTLKPGGWFLARTPNRWGMTAIGATIIPNKLHLKALGLLTPEREQEDVFPTAYKLNTRHQLAKHFPKEIWDHYSYFQNSEPPYVHGSKALMTLGRLYQWLVPPTLATNLVVILRKREG